MEEGGMKTETANTILRTWMSRVWNELDADAIDELLAEDAIAHGLGDQPLRGPADWRAFHTNFLAAFSDINVDVEDQVVDGDKVSARLKGTMRHRASGKPVTFTAAAMARVAEGKIQEAWNILDFLPALTALGIVPPDAMARALATS
jgi:ketosteroid isomerase-like protein